MKNMLILLLVLSLSSCQSTRKIMDSWLNSTKQELIMGLGPPTKSTSDGGSGEIMVYSRQVYISATQHIDAHTIWVNKYFYVNASGRIYHWVAKRERTPPQ